ncbi:MAG: hypothetical protein WC119_05800 [Synergistaceae bacterium]
MNKFLVFPCVEQNGENGYSGSVVSLASTANVTFMLFFPIAQEYARLINFLLKKEESDNMNLQLLAVYQTMINSWQAGDRYLSGIAMDAQYDEETKEDTIAPTLIICDSLGNVDAVVNVNFVHAIMLAAMQRKEILVTNELLHKLMPIDAGDEEEELDDSQKNSSNNASPFPVDKQLIDIAKNIMGGKKESKGTDDSEEEF